MEDLLCPACGEELDVDKDITQALVCPYCKTKWQQDKYRDFLETLMYEDIIDNIDLSRLNSYGGRIDEDLLNMDEIEGTSPGSSATTHDKYRDDFDEFEDDAEIQQHRRSGTISEDDWDIFSDDVALEEDWDDTDKVKPEEAKKKSDKEDDEDN